MENLDFIKDEMLTHVAINTHKEPKSILIINGNNTIKEELSKYNFLNDIVSIDLDVINKFQNLGTKKFDIAIVNTNKYTNNREFWIELTKLLDSKALVTIKMSNIFTQEDMAKDELKRAGSIYRIVMPYRYEELIDNKVVNNYLMIASRFYHPVADINLQRADLTDGYKYYNADISRAAFEVPTFIYKKYLGIIKR